MCLLGIAVIHTSQYVYAPVAIHEQVFACKKCKNVFRKDMRYFDVSVCTDMLIDFLLQ